MYNTQTNRPACCNRVKRVAAANSKYDGRCKQKTASRIDSVCITHRLTDPHVVTESRE